jgi:flagellar hook assembly protein FlgD
MTWSPASGSVPDGTDTWSLSATDAWGNGPLAATGPIVVDTEAPTVTVADADAAALPSFAPNGDGYRDTIGFAVGTDEPGTITGTVKNAAGSTVDSISITPGGATGTLTWDGKAGSSYAADGTYTISVVARDRAGNASAAQARDFDLYGSLMSVASSKAVFYPQDGDGVSSSTGLTFTLKHAATVTWRVVDARGTPVRTIRSADALAAGSYSFTWNGRNDAGAYVARGTYRSTVYATSGGLSASQAATVELNAFRVTSSDATPGRGQRITVMGFSAESLKSSPKVVVTQPGLTAWTVSMTKSGSSYIASVQLKSSSKTGTLRLKVYGYDAAGHYQFTYLELPIH